MPGTLKMLKGPCSTNPNFFRPILIHPMSGSNKVIHAIVVGSEGTMYEIQNMNSKVWLKGILVRARIQAMATPIGKLAATVTDQMKRELPNERSKPGRRNAFCQWRSPQLRGSTNQSAAVLKLLIKSRMTGQMRKQPSNNRTDAMMK